MKKIISLILAIAIGLCTCGCSQERTTTTDYQYMYDGVVKAWNKTVSPECRRNSLLGFGEYLYNSYLLLFPRQTPSTLDEFYFYWLQSIDVDGYAIYFTCQLSPENYSAFTNGLAEFRMNNNGTVNAPHFDDVHFSLPAYILQWSHVGEKWEVLEYILLDDETNTAVFVYTMGQLPLIEEHSAYTVTPTELHFSTEDFSIYQNFESSTYNISFLKYLL